MPMTRQHFHEELQRLEASALGGLDLVVEQLDRVMEALEHRDIELAQTYTIVIVTHNMQQAARVADFTAFMMMGEDRQGELVELGPTVEIFNRPKDSRTEDYITGRFG